MKGNPKQRMMALGVIVGLLCLASFPLGGNAKQKENKSKNVQRNGDSLLRGSITDLKKQGRNCTIYMDVITEDSEEEIILRTSRKNCIGLSPDILPDGRRIIGEYSASFQGGRVSTITKKAENTDAQAVCAVLSERGMIAANKVGNTFPLDYPREEWKQYEGQVVTALISPGGGSMKAIDILPLSEAIKSYCPQPWLENH